MAKRYIVMGDVIGSSRHDARRLRRELMRLVECCNANLQQEILSPYTVTLGDEFQGVARSLRGAIEAIFWLEDTLLRSRQFFALRYVTLHGTIDTPLNQLRAHTMMGPGLTDARKMLTDKRRGKPRFSFRLRDGGTTDHLNRLFLALDGIAGRWRTDDGPLVLDMLEIASNQEVGQMHGKNRSQIWKRRRHLLVEEYRALRETIIELAK